MVQTLNKKDIWRIRISVAVWSYVTSVLMATIWLGKQDWFGVSDLKGFSIISIVFALGISLLGAKIATVVKCKSGIIKYSVAMIIGVLYGFASIVVLFLIIGTWILAYSFPITFCWVMGGVLGLVAGIISLRKRTLLFTSIQAVSFSVIALAAIWSYNPMSMYASNDQELHVVIVKCDEGESPLIVDSENYGTINIRVHNLSSSNSVKLDFTSEDEKMLQLAGVKGHCKVINYSVHGSGTFSKAIIVLREIPLRLIKLYQPDESSIIYIQDGQKFSIFPENAPTLDRTIELRRSLSDINTNDSNNVVYMVELAGGGKQGGFAGGF